MQQGAVQFEFPLSKGVAGVVVREPSTPWVSQEALAGILPSLATLGLPQNVTERLIQGLSSAEVLHQLNNSTSRDQAGEPGIISYQLNGWQQDTILFHWKDCKNLRNIRAGSKVIENQHSCVIIMIIKSTLILQLYIAFVRLHLTLTKFAVTEK